MLHLPLGSPSIITVREQDNDPTLGDKNSICFISFLGSILVPSRASGACVKITAQGKSVQKLWGETGEVVHSTPHFWSQMVLTTGFFVE